MRPATLDVGDRVRAVAAALATAAVAVEVYCDWPYTPDASAKSAAVLEKIMIPRVVVILHRRVELEDGHNLPVLCVHFLAYIYTHSPGRGAFTCYNFCVRPFSIGVAVQLI